MRVTCVFSLEFTLKKAAYPTGGPYFEAKLLEYLLLLLGSRRVDERQSIRGAKSSGIVTTGPGGE